MSAFVVEDRTINRVLAHLVWWAGRGAGAPPHAYAARNFLAEHGVEYRAPIAAIDEGLARLGQAVFDMNVRAVDARYGAGSAAEFRALDYTYGRLFPPTPIQAYKSLRCLLYQCTEGDVPEEPLYKELSTLADDMAVSIVEGLPEYERAEWR